MKEPMTDARRKQLYRIKKRKRRKQCIRVALRMAVLCFLVLFAVQKTADLLRVDDSDRMEDIHSLICSTYGHTLVLFTSYHLMGNVYQVLRDEIPFPMIEVWRHSPEEITRFKQTDNAVLFAAGSCWEGVDFPGDMVSSLIIVKLPFAVPDPISEAQKKEYDCLKDYIQAVVVPDMQKKLRQGFGRALRTETDTCVVTILDERAGEDGRYHEEVMCALPKCKMAEDIKDVQRFIRNRKGVEYYL